MPDINNSVAKIPASDSADKYPGRDRLAADLIGVSAVALDLIGASTIGFPKLVKVLTTMVIEV